MFLIQKTDAFTCSKITGVILYYRKGLGDVLLSDPLTTVTTGEEINKHVTQLPPTTAPNSIRSPPLGFIPLELYLEALNLNCNPHNATPY